MVNNNKKRKEKQSRGVFNTSNVVTTVPPYVSHSFQNNDTLQRNEREKKKKG